jgi:DUF4097 and DUF4098 domain-containing protein YvlB
MFTKLLSTAAFLACTLAADTDEFRWKGRIASGMAFEIKGINGAIAADTAAGDEAEVVATKTGRRDDPKKVEIKVVEHAGGVTVCAVYPSRDPDRPNECKPGKEGRNSVRDNDVKVDFAVRVPAGVRFVGRTVNGNIEARALRSNVEAHTVNGSVEVSTRGLVEAQTVNGAIRASLGSTSGSEPLKFNTVNGSITVELPDGANTDVTAETVNGGIETDFPMTIQGRFGPKKLTGKIGSGGRALTLKTVNGSIRLRKAGTV